MIANACLSEAVCVRCVLESPVSWEARSGEHEVLRILVVASPLTKMSCIIATFDCVGCFGTDFCKVIAKPQSTPVFGIPPPSIKHSKTI